MPKSYIGPQVKAVVNYLRHDVGISQHKPQRILKEKAERLRKRLKSNHQEELYKCLFHPSSDFNNNFVERMLRPNVIMHKLTFGNRSDKGIENHVVVTSLLQTAKLNKCHPQNVFYRILTKPKEITLSNFIRASSR